MKVLVPLPFDLSNLVHGRNLRIVHVLRELRSCCELSCLAPNGRLADAAREVLPGVAVRAAGGAPDQSQATIDLSGGSRWLGRAVSFLGCDPSLAAEIARCSASVGAVLGFDMPSVPYLLAAMNGRRSNAGRPRLVCDLIDDPWLLRKSFPFSRRWSPAGFKSAAAMWIIRRRILRLFDSLIAVGAGDARSLSRASGREVVVIPNGVEVEPGLQTARPREPLVVLTGDMSFPANEAAARFAVRRVWPRVLRRHREVVAQSDHPVTGMSPLPTLAIVGANPTARVRGLAGEPGVVVTGRVPSVSEWLHRASVALAPMVSGCGIKNKILEACAAGCSVISTTRGAAGLPVGEHTGILIADQPEQMASEVVRLLLETKTARRIGSAGQAMVREQFSWPGAAEAFLQVLQGCSIVGRSTREAEPPDEASIHPAMTTDREAARREEVLAHAAS